MTDTPQSPQTPQSPGPDDAATPQPQNSPGQNSPGQNSPGQKTPGQKTPDQKTPPAVRWALIGSLALNLLFIGLIGGAVLRNDGRPDGGERYRVDGPNPFLRALTRDEAREVGQYLRTAREGNLADGRLAGRAAMENVLSTLRAAPFDEDALRAALDHVSAVNTQRAMRGQDAVVDLVVTFSADERLAFADRLEAALQRGPANGLKDRMNDRPGERLGGPDRPPRP